MRARYRDTEKVRDNQPERWEDTEKDRDGGRETHTEIISRGRDKQTQRHGGREKQEADM